MISFYLAAACCLPSPNPEGRIKERALLNKAAQERAREKKALTTERPRGRRWDVIVTGADAEQSAEAA